MACKVSAGTESVRLRKVSLVAVNGPKIARDRSAFWDQVALYQTCQVFVWLNRRSRYSLESSRLRAVNEADLPVPLVLSNGKLPSSPPVHMAFLLCLHLSGSSAIRRWNRFLPLPESKPLESSKQPVETRALCKCLFQRQHRTDSQSKMSPRHLTVHISPATGRCI